MLFSNYGSPGAVGYDWSAVILILCRGAVRWYTGAHRIGLECCDIVQGSCEMVHWSLYDRTEVIGPLGTVKWDPGPMGLRFAYQ